MTLYLEDPVGTFTAWLGAPIRDVRRPLNIEQLWTTDELADVDLYIPAAADAVPNGKVVTSTSVQRVDGVVKFVDALQDAPPPTSEQIAAEVERRIALPLRVDGLSVDGFQINMDAPSQRNLQGLASVGMYLASAAPSLTTAFRDYSNEQHDLLPTDLVAMGLQVAERIQAVYEASWALKAMNPVPNDYADDSYWP